MRAHGFLSKLHNELNVGKFQNIEKNNPKYIFIILSNLKAENKNNIIINIIYQD